MAADTMEIDDSLYSRQRYVLGDNAMHQMAQSHVFLSGIGGLGVEIAKNIILAGIKAVTIQDTVISQTWNLGTAFFIDEEDVANQRNRAKATISRLAELNPYVQVNASTVPLDENTDLTFLQNYQCVVLTETQLSLQKKINAFCRSQDPPIKFISADLYGVFCRVFCDFGDHFEVSDSNGEEPKEIFIHNITQCNPGVVTCMDNRTHGLETGQFVTFREINGMSELNRTARQITVVSPYSFSIGDTSNYKPYLHGGISLQLKISKKFTFENMETQLLDPQCLIVDFSKPEAPLQIHTAMLALDMFQEQHKRLPNIGCLQDADELVKLAFTVNETMKNKGDVNEELIKCLSRTAKGFLTPLAAAFGGITSQEVLKALTGKFSPLQQWLYFDVMEIPKALEDISSDEFQPRGDRYDALRACIGESMCEKLRNLNVFLVGCGAIGCEMLKNFALLGVGSGSDRGLITVTDPDLIEKSNLNRQFLFRPHHIQKSKSCTAASATMLINPHLKIDPHLNKVCPSTENTYSDSFYTSLDVVVTALDNVEARRYVDSRCVSNQCPLLDSGTMGTKGHTEIIVPNLTESYNSHRDPPEEEIPFCTLKSFPALIEHTIQWARDKFESSFSYKPSIYNKFWQSYPSPDNVLQRIQAGESLEGSFQAIKLLIRRPRHWPQCVSVARTKFEKYFHHKAVQLLHSFPLDTTLKDGSLFWQSPKRPPSPITFDINDPLHHSFILNAARLFATVYSVPYEEQDLSREAILQILSKVKVPEFTPSEKQIVTDENIKKSDQSKLIVSSEEERVAIDLLSEAISTGLATKDHLIMMPVAFEKDDDRNGHIDFITAGSNLRANMYNIETADRLKTKRIAGRIIPAIATATAAVSGLVALELIKVAGGHPFEAYRNCFFNLAIPVIVFTEPAEVKKTQVRNEISFTIWDRWTIYGREDFTLLDFIKAVKEMYSIDLTMVVHGVKMLYVPVMPGHTKRLKLTMQKLVKPTSDRKYVDLTVSFAPLSDGDEDLPGPPVRYYFRPENN
ncbi:ubiquitin-like modifier-activating enzyme 6 isoform X2 [Callorhinchus milii]|uniref:ubiquitin-like modifier-activating enzyme 6 isoform X2 n=1 Tax=Callorhinchus milii TaxID=7868 RepID=UPI0004572BA0|nr:ubiquitin-like modifier-activating enzyme 6 isoform X2 [Callorhinchus milii]|eukprot:gi/632949469/ref/XP_007890173.1/ PREDICTED: ubiquitin-like modifier-activating enzyme 6 isoform X2 [Callorhinchus milii]